MQPAAIVPCSRHGLIGINGVFNSELSFEGMCVCGGGGGRGGGGVYGRKK